MSDYKDIYYKVSDGLTLYARDYPGPASDAPVVLCMHGLTRNSRDFERIAPALAETHRVIVVEQRGRGKSEYDPEISRYQPQTYIGDMMELLGQQSITRCDVVGTSMGGLMAMGMNALAPDLFDHVVINDIGPVVAEAGLARIKHYVGSASEFDTWKAADAYNQTINGAAFPEYGPEDWRRFSQQLCSERDGKVVLDYDLNLSKPMKDDDEAAVPPDLWPIFDLLSAKPLLVVRGTTSDILDAPTTAEMQRHHPGMQLLEVEGIGHAPMLDEPGVTEAITAFINS